MDNEDVVLLKRTVERYQQRIDALEATIRSTAAVDVRERKSVKDWQMQLTLKVQHMDEERRKLLLDRTLAEERSRRTKAELQRLSAQVDEVAAVNSHLRSKLSSAEVEIESLKSLLKRYSYTNEELESWRSTCRHTGPIVNQPKQVPPVVVSSENSCSIKIDRLEREKRSSVDELRALRVVVEQQKKLFAQSEQARVAEHLRLESKLATVYKDCAELRATNQKLTILIKNKGDSGTSYI